MSILIAAAPVIANAKQEFTIFKSKQQTLMMNIIKYIQ